jgi:hypothetical protein
MKAKALILHLIMTLFLASCNTEESGKTSSPAKHPQEPEAAVEVKEKGATSSATQNFSQQAAQSDLVNESLKKVIGAWLSNDDVNWKLVFTAEGKCFQYYGEELLETDSFMIANTSPQCEEEVQVNSTTMYLQLENIEDKEKTCYEIYALTENVLTVRPLTRGGIMTFSRQ